MQLKISNGIKSITVKQNGAALLMLLLVILLVIAAGLFKIVDPEAKRIRMEQRTHKDLAKAKEALIAYAVTSYESNPGVFARFPCVDSGTAANEGVQDTNCGTNNANSIGRLPWRTLGIGPLKDGSGECLWYAISGHHKNNNSAMLLNEDSPGLIRLYASDGVTELTTNDSQNRIVAAVIAPGSPMQWQNRNNDPTTECGGNYNAADFLESVGNAVNAGFSGTPYGLDGIAQGDDISKNNPNIDNRINDKIITITRQEIWDALRDRPFPNIGGLGEYYPYSDPSSDIFSELTRQLAECVANYGRSRDVNDRRLPWAVPIDLGSPTIQRYSHENNYEDQADNYGGRFPYRLTVTSATLDGASDTFSASAGVGSDPCSEFRNGSVYENLWNHWKDHVFYAVSEARSPNSNNPSQLCGGPNNLCLSVNGYEYAAIVMFAGSPLDTPACNPPAPEQSRDAPPDNNAKALTCNYLEGGNDITLDGENGDGIYQYQLGNDIMVCICENLDCNPLTPEIDVDTDCDAITAL